MAFVGNTFLSKVAGILTHAPRIFARLYAGAPPISRVDSATSEEGGGGIQGGEAPVRNKTQAACLLFFSCAGPPGDKPQGVCGTGVGEVRCKLKKRWLWIEGYGVGRSAAKFSL